MVIRLAGIHDEFSATDADEYDNMIHGPVRESHAKLSKPGDVVGKKFGWNRSS
jgi:hypothetical protein